jgi:ribonuclease R
MGDKLTIKVVAANLTKRQLDYEWVITSVLSENRPASQEQRPVVKEKEKGKRKKKK